VERDRRAIAGLGPNVRGPGARARLAPLLGPDGLEHARRGHDAQRALVDDPRRLGLGNERRTLRRQGRNP